MKYSIMMAMLSLMLASCMVADRRGGGIEVVPILPVVVDVYDDGYYSQNGYHYFYVDDRWVYSTSRNGPRMDLPRDHWPRETRRNRGNRGDGNENRRRD